MGKLKLMASWLLDFNEVARQFATFGFSPQGDLAERHGAYEQTFRPGNPGESSWSTKSIRVACMPSDKDSVVNFLAEFRIMFYNERGWTRQIKFQGCICKSCGNIPELVREAVELSKSTDTSGFVASQDEDVLDWDAHLEVPPPRPGGTIKVRLEERK